MATYKARDKTAYIVVHCSATKGSADIDAATIDRWHRAKGWNGIGYSRVIKRDGKIEQGRPDNAVGAHVENFNAVSVGICMVGGIAEDGKTPENNFTPDQYMSLLVVLKELKKAYPKAEVLGHRDLSPDKNGDGKLTKNEWLKDCPCFDVRAWWATFA